MKANAKKYHYVYHMCISDEQMAIAAVYADLPLFYIGMRSCNCHPEHDTGYMSSSEYVKAAMASGVPFVKNVVAIYSTRAEAAAHERRALHAAKYERSIPDPVVAAALASVGRTTEGSTRWHFYLNRVVPGEFGVIDYANRLASAIKRGKGKKEYTLTEEGRANRRGGPSKDYVPTATHVARVKVGKQSHWDDLKAFAAYHGLSLKGKGAPNIDRKAFSSWRKTVVSGSSLHPLQQEQALSC